MIYLESYEEDGKFYFEDSTQKVETSELVDVFDGFCFDDENGYILGDGRLLSSVIINQVKKE